MKLATIKDGSRDGQLAVVSRDLKSAHMADTIAPTLRAALDDWAFIAPQLDSLYAQLNANATRRAFDFDPARCMAPLPRASQRVEGGAYLHHAELLRELLPHRAGLPPVDGDAPLMHQAGGDDLLGAHDDIVLAHEEWGIDFGAGLAVIVDDVPMGATPDEAHGRIRLLMLANDVALRSLAADELARGTGFLQSRPAAGCSPVAVTPDELGEAWRGGRVHGVLRSTLNGHLVGQPDAGVDMAFNFPQLIAHLCRSRTVRAGAIVGTGPVSNREAGAGYACIAEQRSREAIADGTPSTPFMRFGDTIRIEMLDEKGKSIFGAIEQAVRRPER
ncbi:MAG: fumarylacetoacetate hydrolase [Massilia sp.]|jgi:fumarylacetoacetate (FAA) hydrolase